MIVRAVISILLLGLIASGCGHRNKRMAAREIDGHPAGSFRIQLFEASEAPADVSSARLMRIKAAAVFIQDVYETDWDYWCPPTQLRVYLKDAGAVPCGIPNGGGCYLPLENVVLVTAGPYDELTFLYHEINHQRLWLTTGQVDPNHQHESWSCALGPRNNRVAEEIRVSRGEQFPLFRLSNVVACPKFGESLPMVFHE